MQLTTLFTVVLLVAGTAISAPVSAPDAAPAQAKANANNKNKVNFGAIKVGKPPRSIKMARSLEKREPEPVLKFGGEDLLPSLRQPPGGTAAETGKAGTKQGKKAKRAPNQHKKPAEKNLSTDLFKLLRTKKHFGSA